MGDVVAAVDRYQDIPVDTRNKLKARMAKRDYDEIVSIKRDGINGQAKYGSDISDMYFGSGSICKTVTRSKWTNAMEERGLVYCEDGQCILVPTVCRNVSRIKRLAPRPVAAAGGGAPASSTREGLPPETELAMDPTGAGPLGAGAPGAGPTSFAQLAGPVPEGGLPAGPVTALSAPPSATGPLLGAPILPSLPGSAGPLAATPPTTPTSPGNPTLPAVPEPGTWLLMLSGAAVLAFVARRRQRASA